MLVIDKVQLSLQGRPLFAPLSLTIASGEVGVLMGPSGCGKSSLLGLLAGTLEPVFAVQGQVWLGQQPLLGLPPYQRRVGLLFQDALLFPHLSVADNLALALPRHYRGQQRQHRIEQALVKAELAGMGGRDPATLSGGQRARVSLLRTLLAEPRLLLLDEPFSKLDVQLRTQVRDWVFAHALAAAIPTLLVTHDPQDCPANAQVLQLSRAEVSHAG
ncbi:ATP-binding cassette domain-containing protein [Balneatrix alpica]|uniref:ATP-binding cassette domain-containing protein n=1 Tax=Balneatrix alpica TaxID=75684 RepID=A0ABV5Z973_9GAMM|nr:ATP-binding cassette domain-containing protein [Balneatrix alpica]